MMLPVPSPVPPSTSLLHREHGQSNEHEHGQSNETNSNSNLPAHQADDNYMFKQPSEEGEEEGEGLTEAKGVVGIAREGGLLVTAEPWNDQVALLKGDAMMMGPFAPPHSLSDDSVNVGEAAADMPAMVFDVHQARGVSIAVDVRLRPFHAVIASTRTVSSGYPHPHPHLPRPLARLRCR